MRTLTNPFQHMHILDLAICDGDATPNNHLKYVSSIATGNTCIQIPDGGLRCASWNSRGLLGSTPTSQTTGEQKHRYLKRLMDKNDGVCLQETHGKDEFPQGLQVLRTQFRMFGIFVPGNVNAGGSATFIRKNCLRDRAVVTHEVTYQGRDLIITVHDGRSLLVITNVHFEPIQCPSLRERLRRLSTHWPQYPGPFRVIIGDFNIREPEEGRLNVTNQTFTEGDTGKTALFRTFFPYAMERAQPNFTRKDAAADGTTRTLSRIDRAFINVPNGGCMTSSTRVPKKKKKRNQRPIAEARDFRCHSHVTGNFDDRSTPSDHVAIRVDIRKPQDHCGTSGQVPPWMSQHPFFALS